MVNVWGWMLQRHDRGLKIWKLGAMDGMASVYILPPLIN
jgi:hypothetical protein